MIATEPAHVPSARRSTPGQRPEGRNGLRALALIVGGAGAAAAFAWVGFVAVVAGCVGEETAGLCVHHAELVPALEWAIFLAAVLAPLGGGILSCVRARPAWLLGGLAVAAAMSALIVAVAQGQTGLLG